jgi:rhamnogalacturonan endolyase
VGWRLLASDPDTVAFHVYRNAGDDETSLQRLTPEPIRESTNFVDNSASQVSNPSYCIRTVVNGKEGAISRKVRVTDTDPGASCIRIKLKGEYAARMAALGDLDGDGQLDYIIKQPDFSTDPYQRPGYWKKSVDTYKIEAYRSDGKFLWRHDMGWSIEAGVWYSPYVVYDLDGDGRAEVYTKAGEGDPRDAKGLVTSGPEWLIQIDGLTGKVKRKLPWPDRSGYQDYNWWSRNLLGIAYLDGKHPHLIVQRGTYDQIKVQAYDGQLNLIWQWNSRDEKERYSGSGIHGMHIADVDGDGRDEIVLGSAVLDDHGHGLWTNPMHNERMAHADVCYVGDIDPNHPGLEIFYGFETHQPRDGVCLMNAKTGEILWSYDGPTRHVHNQGMVADILAGYPGQECYAGEKDGSRYWLYSAAGELLGREKIDSLSPRAVWWDADPQKELILSGKVQDYKGEGYQEIEGKTVTIADCLGDWREEIITSLPGELRIYTTAMPAQTRRMCLMQDRQYRLGVTAVSMGYFFPPQLSVRLPME